MWTAQEGHPAVAKLLLERGADATKQDEVLNHSCTHNYFDGVLVGWVYSTHASQSRWPFGCCEGTGAT